MRTYSLVRRLRILYSYKNDQLKVKVKFSFEKPVPESYTSEFVSGSDLVEHFTSGYSHLYSLFSLSQDYGFYGISSNGTKYVLQSPHKTMIINKYEDDLFGIPFYNFTGIYQNQLIGMVDFESILLRLNNPNSKSNPLSKAKLLDFMDKYQLDAEVGDLVIAVFKFKE